MEGINYIKSKFFRNEDVCCEDELTSEEKERCHEKSLIYLDTSTGMETK